MIGTLYRYPHPHDPTRFIYVGQGPNRDKYHRRGKDGFGRRFKRKFPDDVLPEPIKEQIEVSSQLELNEEETIWMFRYHTWHGYPDGENLCLPGLEDYKKVASIGGRIGGLIGGPIGGRMHVESGHIYTIATTESRIKGGQISGQRSVESGFLRRIKTPEILSKGGTAACAVNHSKKNNEGKSLHAIKMGSLGGKISGPIQGKKNAENGHMKRIQVLGASIGGKVATCLRYSVGRGKPCTCGKHLEDKK